MSRGLSPPTPSRQPVLAGALAGIGMLVALAGCESATGLPEGSALDLGQSRYRLCVPNGHIPKVFGQTDLENMSDQPVTITEIALANSAGLRVLGAKVLPAGRHTNVVGEGWPPSHRKDKVRLERRGKDAVGYTVDPGETMSLWVGVSAPDAEGTADAIRVVYERDTATYYQDGLDSLRLASGKTCRSSTATRDGADESQS